MNITIIGAGIAGLVAGILLRQQGFNVKIYEKRSHIEAIGGGLGIWPNGSQVLLTLPCAEKILALTEKIEHDIFADTQGNTITNIPREIFSQINGYPILNMCRSELHQILFHELGSANVVFDAKCIGIEQTKQKVLLKLASGKQVQADFVIGADGTFSSIRKILFPHTAVEYCGYIQLLGVLTNSKKRTWPYNFIWGKNRYSLIFPIANNRSILYQVIPFEKNKLAYEKLTKKQQINLFRGWSKEVDYILDLFETSLQTSEITHHFYCQEAYFMPALTTWHVQRTLLLGDAAHPMGSIMALGASTALEDCKILCDYISHYKDIDLAISAYEKQQMPRAAAFFQLENQVTDFLLNADDQKYQHFMFDLREKSPVELNQAFINLLKTGY